jgi:hypothetical protein
MGHYGPFLHSNVTNNHGEYIICNRHLSSSIYIYYIAKSASITCIFIIRYTLGASISRILQGPRGHIAVGTELLGSPFQCQAVLAHGTFNDPPFIPATSSSGKGEHTQETYKNICQTYHITYIHISHTHKYLGKGARKVGDQEEEAKRWTGVQTATVQVRPKSVLLCVQVSLAPTSLCAGKSMRG